MSATQGIQSAFDAAATHCNDVTVVTTNWFVNRCPLACRTPRVPVGSATFSIISRGGDKGIGGATLVQSQSCQTFVQPVGLTPRYCHDTHGQGMPFDQPKMDGLHDLMDEMERSSYYGTGVDPGLTTRPEQRGIKSLLMNGLGVTGKPENADAFRPADLIRYTLERARTGGGDPDVLLVSPDFRDGFAAWGQALQRIDAGTTVFGHPIDVFESPLLGGVSIIVAPLLRPGTAVALTSSEVRMRMRRNEYWNPTAGPGSAIEGEWVAEGAIEIDDPSHHAWVEGVTGFAGATVGRSVPSPRVVPKSAPRTLGEAVVARWRDAKKD